MKSFHTMNGQFWSLASITVAGMVGCFPPTPFTSLDVLKATLASPSPKVTDMKPKPGPTATPTANPTAAPTANPTAAPTANPTATPTAVSLSLQADAVGPIFVPGTGDGSALKPSSLSLSATVLMTDGGTVSEVVWSTSAAEVATVNLGLVTAVQVGTASITAVSLDGQVSSSYLVEVRDGGRLSVEVN